jgi:hypothetical protein
MKNENDPTEAQGALSPRHGRDSVVSEGPFGLANSKAPMDEAAAGAPAVPFEILRNQLEHYYFGDRSLRTLQHCPEFLRLRFRWHQISDVHEFGRLE